MYSKYILFTCYQRVRISVNVRVSKQLDLTPMPYLSRGATATKASKARALAKFRVTVNPISTRGADYAHYSTMGLVWLKFAVAPLSMYSLVMKFIFCLWRVETSLLATMCLLKSKTNSRNLCLAILVT